MLLRAIVAFLALPGIVTGLIPRWIADGTKPCRSTLPFAAGLLTVGCVLLIWCVRDFFVAGRGTLAPWDPPRHLVVVGLYRQVRNPMYLAVATVLAGWALLYWSAVLGLYLAAVVCAFHWRVVLHEEPRLRRQFGAEWDTYAAKVPRWLPRMLRKTAA